MNILKKMIVQINLEKQHLGWIQLVKTWFSFSNLDINIYRKNNGRGEFVIKFLGKRKDREPQHFMQSRELGRFLRKQLFPFEMTACIMKISTS